jgi:serine/threonine protein kinase
MGGLGRVWLAGDADVNREVALKDIRPDRRASPEVRRRFLLEAQITGQLEHPNIVPVYELSRWPDTGEPFYVMKFVRGRTLAAAIAEHHRVRNGAPPDPLGRRLLLGAFVSVCNAIAYAHARGVLHRDLKPANVVLGKFGEVILLDWGLAKVLDQPGADEELPPVVVSGEARGEVTGVGGRLGTPAYMAPEQARRRPDLVDRSTDVYGLGATLFEILTGHAPHQGDDTDQVCQQIIEEETPRARAAEPAVPAGLDAVCARAMAKAKADRYGSAAELGEAVQRWLADEPLQAYRDIVAELERLAGEHPQVPDYRDQLARNRVNLGLVLGGMGRHGEAEEVFRTAVAEYEALAARHPDQTRYRADLAAARFHLSRALLALDRRDEAQQVQRAAVSDYERLVAANPQAQEYHSNLASVLLTLALGALRITPPAPEQPSTVDERPEPREAEVPARWEQAREMPAHLTLLRQIGAGAMGTVWVARDNDLNREVAIKELREWGDQRRFLREAQITAQLEHPNILPVYGLGYRSRDNAPFLIMRLVRGPNLHRAIADYHSRPRTGAEAVHGLRRLLTAFVAACRALAYAHSRGVIHRDPKPANILLGEGDEVLVADWGLARLPGQQEEEVPRVEITWQADIGATQTGAVMGTPAYMAPEQATGRAATIDARSDIYVLGAVLFEILTGQPPHRGATPMETLVSVVEESTPRARAVRPSVPAALDAVCARAMAREPGDRYAGAAELAQDVENWLAGQPVSVYPESWLRRLGRRLWRR